jgi:hypothetical protein
MKAGYGKTVCPVCAADGGKLFVGRLLRPDSWEADEQSGAIRRGAGGAKDRPHRHVGLPSEKHAPNERDSSVELAAARWQKAVAVRITEGQLPLSLMDHYRLSPCALAMQAAARTTQATIIGC